MIIKLILGSLGDPGSDQTILRDTIPMLGSLGDPDSDKTILCHITLPQVNMKADRRP